MFRAVMTCVCDVLTSALLRYCRCPSAIASKAELLGAKTVIGPGRSRTDARPAFCTDTNASVNVTSAAQSVQTAEFLTHDDQVI